jgi:tetratricopeptide (TPR) repeat protein
LRDEKMSHQDSADDGLTAPQILAEAEQAERSGNRALAIQLAEQATSIEPGNAYAWIMLAQFQYDSQMLDEAELSARKVIAVDPSLAGGYSILGHCLRDRGRLEEAVWAFEQRVKSLPSATGFVLLGDIQAALERDDDAENSFRKALDLEPNNEEVLLNLGLLYRSEKPEEAARYCERAISIDNDYACAYRELGFVLAKLQKHELAQRNLEKAIELNPKDFWSHTYLAALFREQGRLNDAERSLNRAVSADPTDSLPHRMLGDLRIQQGRPKEAEKHYEEAVACNEEDSDSMIRLAMCLKDQGELPRARGLLERALRLAPNSAQALALRRELFDQ